ncbi:MAG: potassium channel protein [Bacteroidota bacterium]
MVRKSLRKALEQNTRYKRMNSYKNRFFVGLILLCSILIAGVVGYMIIEQYSFQEAFYMTIITMSTVGFGEVKPLTGQGRLFTSFLIIFNLAIFAYALSLISSFLMEAGFKKLFKDYLVLSKIDKLKDHVIVCGFGRHGEEVVNELIQNKMDFVIIENDEKQLEQIQDDKGFLYIEGDATNDDLLKEAGIEKAGALVVTLSDETENLYVVISARQLNANVKIITRASSIKSEKKLIHAGANHVVLPERISGFYMARLVNSPEKVEFFNILSNINEDGIEFEEINVSDFRGEFVNKSIIDLDLRKKTGINIIGLKTLGGIYQVNPAPNMLLTKEMTLVVLGTYAQLDKFKGLILKQH